MKSGANILLSILGFTLLLTGPGCSGIQFPPPVFQMKPWTMLTQGEQLGRDQLANRYLVASDIVPINGWHENSVLNILGQPQEIDVQQHEVSEDWYYIYYKAYKTQPQTDEGLFIVRFYHDEVIDVVNLSQ